MIKRKPRKMPKLPTWTSAYMGNCYSFRRGFMSVTINMDGGGYRITVAGRECSKKVSSISEGKIIAMAALKDMAEITIKRAEEELSKLQEECSEINLEELIKDVKWKRG